MDSIDEAEGRAGSGRRPRRGPPEGDLEFIQSLAKGLAVIEAFSERTPQMTLSEVSRRVGLSPGSARRVLRTLHLLGYASCRGTRFELTPRVLQLGYSYLTSMPIANLVRPRLTQLTEEVDANCSVAVLDGADVVFVARTTAKRTVRECLAVGTRFPAHTTSAGKVLLAELDRREVDRLYAGREFEAFTQHTVMSMDALHDALDQVRKDGWALNDQETLMGHRSISVPVRVNGEVVAAAGVGAHIGVATMQRMVESYLPPLRIAAKDISQLLQIHASPQSRGREAEGGRRPTRGAAA